MNNVLEGFLIIVALIASSFIYQTCNYFYQVLELSLSPHFDIQEAWKRGYFMAMGGLAVFIFFK